MVPVTVLTVYVIPIPTDPSLNLSNLTSALDSLPGSEWRGFGRLVNVPESMLDEIESQFHSDEERKTAVLRVCLADHPKPTWELVSDVIYRMGYHNVLERLLSLFPTGEHLSVPHISTPHTPSFTPSSHLYFLPCPIHSLISFVSHWVLYNHVGNTYVCVCLCICYCVMHWPGDDYSVTVTKHI